MQILYGCGMLAILVLCLALLSTARRILCTSPLSNAQFGAARMYGVERAEEALPDEISSARMLTQKLETAQIESTSALIEPVHAHPTPVETAPAKTILSEPVTAIALRPTVSDEQTWGPQWARFPKPTRQTYNYALECLLIGVSAWVLIKTQRDTLHSKSRPASTSRNRVA